MADFETILGGFGVKASASALDRAYDDSGGYLGRVWAKNRDVGVADHVRAILGVLDSKLPGRVPADVMSALIDAYARPILLVPPSPRCPRSPTPSPSWRNRGAPRLRRSAPNVWGFGGHVGAPI